MTDLSPVSTAAVGEWVREVLEDDSRPLGLGPHPDRRAGLSVWSEVDGTRTTTEFLLLDLNPEQARLAVTVTSLPLDTVGTLRVPPPDEGWVTMLVHARLIPVDDITHTITQKDAT